MSVQVTDPGSSGSFLTTRVFVDVWGPVWYRFVEASMLVQRNRSQVTVVSESLGS